MNKGGCYMFFFFLVMLTACCRDSASLQDNEERERRYLSQMTNKVLHSKREKIGQIVDCRTNQTAYTMQVAIRQARTPHAGRKTVEEIVSRIIVLNDTDKRFEQMLMLAEIVFQRPIDCSTPSNRANGHLIIFNAELEVFDGFLKIGQPEEAWRLLLRTIRSYRKTRDKAKIEMDRCPNPRGCVPFNLEAHKAREGAECYYRVVNHDYKCAVHTIKDFILPHVKSKFTIPVTLEDELSAELTEPY